MFGFLKLHARSPSQTACAPACVLVAQSTRQTAHAYKKERDLGRTSEQASIDWMPNPPSRARARRFVSFAGLAEHSVAKGQRGRGVRALGCADGWPEIGDDAELALIAKGAPPQ